MKGNGEQGKTGEYKRMEEKEGGLPPSEILNTPLIERKDTK